LSEYIQQIQQKLHSLPLSKRVVILYHLVGFETWSFNRDSSSHRDTIRGAKDIKEISSLPPIWVCPKFPMFTNSGIRAKFDVFALDNFKIKNLRVVLNVPSAAAIAATEGWRVGCTRRRERSVFSLSSSPLPTTNPDLSPGPHKSPGRPDTAARGSHAPPPEWRVARVPPTDETTAGRSM